MERYALRGGHAGYARLKVLAPWLASPAPSTCLTVPGSVRACAVSISVAVAVREPFEFFKQMMPRVIQHSGGDALIGLRLYQFFLHLGTPEPQLSRAQNVDASSETNTLPLLTLQSVAESIVAGGLASAARVAAAADDLAQFTAAPRHHRQRPARAAGLGVEAVSFSSVFPALS